MSHPLPHATRRARGLGAAGAVVAAGALLAAGSLAGAGPAAAARTSSSQSPSALWVAALANAEHASDVAFTISQKANGITSVLAGHAGRSTGEVHITYTKGSTHGEVDELLTHQVVYFKGDDTGLEQILELPNNMAKVTKGRWVSAAADGSTNAKGAYQSLVAGLTVSAFAQNFAMSGPYAFGAKKKVDGAAAVTVKGFVDKADTSSKSAPIDQDFVVTTGSHPLPVAESATGTVSGQRVSQDATMTWNASFSVSAPAKSSTMSFDTLLAKSQGSPAG